MGETCMFELYIETIKIMSGVAPRTSPSRLASAHFLARLAQAGLLLAGSRRQQATYATDEWPKAGDLRVCNFGGTST